jgi:hypothetical protein
MSELNRTDDNCSEKELGRVLLRIALQKVWPGLDILLRWY